MTLDYSSAVRAPRPAATKTVLIAGLIAVTAAAAVMLHENNTGGAAPATVSATATAAPQAASPSALASNQAPLPLHHYQNIVNSAVETALETPPDDPWQSVTVARGQTLSTIFKAHGLGADDWISLLALGGGTSHLRHLQIGHTLRLQVANGQLQALSYAYAPTHTLDIQRTAHGLQAHTITATLDHRSVEVSGQIHSSLSIDGQHAGLSSRLIQQFAHIFNADIDFGQDLQAGDRFTVIYNQVYKNGKKLRDGNILAAELVNRGHAYRAIRFVGKHGDAAYYTPKGRSLHPAFLRHPVAYTYISSGFSLHRMNPVLHIVRPHYGTDFAAPMGTPVHVTSNGRVVAAGRERGYGNVIKVRDGRYETVYAHLSRFRKGLHVGSWVKQDQVIGYVGMTGLATGPHLHYEFHINGKPMNPVTVKLPGGPPLPPHEMVKFRKQEKPLIARIDNVDTRQFADNGPTIGTR